MSSKNAHFLRNDLMKGSFEVVELNYRPKSSLIADPAKMATFPRPRSETRTASTFLAIAPE
jgi:hypothetical protein